MKEDVIKRNQIFNRSYACRPQKLLYRPSVYKTRNVDSVLSLFQNKAPTPDMHLLLI